MKRLVLVVTAVLTALSLSCGRKAASSEISSVFDAKKSTQRLEVNDSLPTRINIHDNLRYLICKNPLQPVELEFGTAQNCLLRAEISGVPDTANLHFNVIILPNGRTDTLGGGKSIEYDLADSGTYRLLLGEGGGEEVEPWGGDFTFDIEVARRIPSVVGRNYYVLNSLHKGSFTQGVIEDREQFDAIFGPAAVMGAKPTEIDFERQYVIAVVDNMSDDAVHLNLVSLLEVDGKVVMSYQRERSGKRSYSVRPYLIVIIDRQYFAPVEIVEV